MSATDPIIDVLDRVQETVHAVLDGLDEEQLTARVDPEANSIAWLVWHLTRIQDDHLAAAARAAPGMDVGRLGRAFRAALLRRGDRVRTRQR